MKTGLTAALAAGCLLVGMGVGYAAKEKSPGIELMRGKPPKEAGIAALQQAEKLAGQGSWERLGVARVYYLSGDKATGQALIDKVLNGKAESSDLQRAGEIYAEAGETARAEELFQKVLAADKKQKDDTGRAEIGAWYIRIGQRDKGEELLAQALARNPDELWHYVRAAEAYLGVPPGR
jgi:tetratricopeptide (TPR) repeat protein